MGAPCNPLLQPLTANAGLLERRDDDSDDKHQSVVEHVFHGTPPSNLKSIMKDGMNPSRRKYAADYFSSTAFSSIGFCGETLAMSFRPARECVVKLLVFLVLKLPPGFVAKNGDVVTMREVDYELPILEATVVRRGGGVMGR